MTNIEVSDKLRSIMCSKDEVLSRCFFNLLPKGYKDRTNLVTEPVTDTLELEYKIDISDVIDSSNIVMSYENLKYCSIDKETLIDCASYNTQHVQQPRFDSVLGMLGISSGDDEQFPMYCLTNIQMKFGAGVILYDNMYEKIAKIVGEDFTVIPSSIHETIIIPGEYDISNVTNIIQIVNAETVAEEDYLSDKPYKLTPAGELIEA